MATTLTNALLLDLDPLGVREGGLRIADGLIAAVGPRVSPRPGDELVDCGGCVVMPGLVNGHAHLYSALAVGMPPPAQAPRNFLEILERVWWRLDRALDAECIVMSGTIGALDALHCGTTTLIDHHASPNCIGGSLDLLEEGVDAVGLRGVLSYEVTDRNGPAGAEAGVEENRRYAEKSQKVEKSKSQKGGGRFAGMVGAHAAFTLSDESLRACVQLAAELETGVHIHVAEDPCDDGICRRHYHAPLISRLQKCGLLDARLGVAGRSILAHGTHLSPQDARRISARVAAMAHNPRSNMNNRVGYAPVARMTNVALGTDGIGSDMFTEGRFAWFKACEASAQQPARGPIVTPIDIVAMLAHSARVASRLLGTTLGQLTPGAAADLVITDYLPGTRLDRTNAAGHLLHALGPQDVRDVFVGGEWVLRDRSVSRICEEGTRQAAVPLSRQLWGRMASLP